MISAKYNSADSVESCRAELGVHMIRITICDDNRPFMDEFRSKIRSMLSRRNIDAEIRIFDCAESIPDDLISSTDIFFLDIDFTDKRYNGIDIAKKIRRIRKDPIIVFVTNFIEYAPEGYEVQAFRYLLKRKIGATLEQCLLQTIDKLQAEQEAIQINTSGETRKFPLSDILYIESQAHLAVMYVQKHGHHAVKTYKFYSSLSSLEEQLSPKGFLRIQKSYLVNMKHLQKYQCTQAVLDNGTILPVSEKTYSQQKQKYLLWKGRQ